MRKSNKNKILTWAVFVLFVMVGTKTNAQQSFSVKLKSEIQNLKPDVYTISFIPIDSILNKNENIPDQVSKELSRFHLDTLKQYTFTIKFGYYQSDTINSDRNLKIFKALKKLLRGKAFNRAILVDMNCYDLSGLQAEAKEFEHTSGMNLQSSLYVNLYKTKKRIIYSKSKRRKECMF